MRALRSLLLFLLLFATPVVARSVTDSAGRTVEVPDTVTRVFAAEGLTILISTHEPEQAFAIADRVAVLGAGNHFLTRAVAEVLTAEQLSRLYGVKLVVERTSSGRYVVGPAERPLPGRRIASGK